MSPPCHTQPPVLDRSCRPRVVAALLSLDVCAHIGCFAVPPRPAAVCHSLVPFRYAIFGSREDYRVVLKFRTGAYKVHNLHILDEQGTHKIDNLRLIGIGGDVNTGKLLDGGEFNESTVAGDGRGMWVTLMQLGKLVKMAASVYDPTELRMLVAYVISWLDFPHHSFWLFRVTSVRKNPVHNQHTRLARLRDFAIWR